MSDFWTRLGNVLAYITAVVLIAYAAAWVGQNWEKVSLAFSFSPGYFAVLLPLVIASILLVGLMNQLMASHLGAPLCFKQWAALAFASSLANYILPMRAGAVLRASYFKQRCDLPVTKFTSTMAVVYVMALWTNSVAGLSAIAWFYLQKELISWTLLWGFLGVAGFCSALLTFSPKPRKSEPDRRLLGIIVRIHAGWDMLRRCPVLLAKAGGLSLALTVLYVIRLYVSFAAIGHPVNLPGCLLIAALTAVSVFIAITPAGLGIQEAAIVFAGMMVGVAPEISLLAGAMDRAVSTLVVLVFGSLGMVSLAH
ncbi:MAG: flippase-like domain-containing protein [Desulfuromonadales bacterium]|nr:flippase-like domain-containing protein [Desulfuromonadales bacterium]